MDNVGFAVLGSHPRQIPDPVGDIEFAPPQTRDFTLALPRQKE